MNQVVNLNAPSRIMRPDQNTANGLDLSDVNSYKKKAKSSQTVKGIYLVVVLSNSSKGTVFRRQG